jgi:nitric oxide reductase large subunit
VTDKLRWLRVLGDTAFAAGAIAFVVAVARITLRRAPRQ